jgi:hypothetical protein
MGDRLPHRTSCTPGIAVIEGIAIFGGIGSHGGRDADADQKRASGTASMDLEVEDYLAALGSHVPSKGGGVMFVPERATFASITKFDIRGCSYSNKAGSPRRGKALLAHERERE